MRAKQDECVAKMKNKALFDYGKVATNPSRWLSIMWDGEKLPEEALEQCDTDELRQTAEECDDVLKRIKDEGLASVKR